MYRRPSVLSPVYRRQGVQRVHARVRGPQGATARSGVTQPRSCVNIGGCLCATHGVCDRDEPRDAGVVRSPIPHNSYTSRRDLVSRPRLVAPGRWAEAGTCGRFAPPLVGRPLPVPPTLVHPAWRTGPGRRAGRRYSLDRLATCDGYRARYGYSGIAEFACRQRAARNGERAAVAPV